VSWPTVTLGLCVLGLSCMLLGTYVVGPMLRPRAQAVPTVSPATYAPAPPTVTPPQPTLPPGQSSVHVTERAPEPEPAPKPPPEVDTITPEIKPSADIPATPSPDANADSGNTAPTPAEVPPSPGAPATPAADAPAPQPINLAPPPPASLHEPAPAAEPPTRYYRVQVGRFAGRADAEALRGELAAQGYSPTVVTVRRDGREEFRVQVNTYRLRENATKTMDELKQKQYAPYVAEENP
jgi:hypothetical protein